MQPVPISVVGAVIRRGNSVLLTQRKPTQAEPLKWEFPGGKLEPGESPQEALERELAEELGIETEVGGLFEVVLHDYGDRTIHLMTFLVTIKKGEPRPIDCHAARWVPVGMLQNFDVCGADEPVVKRLVSGQ